MPNMKIFKKNLIIILCAIVLAAWLGFYLTKTNQKSFINTNIFSVVVPHHNLVAEQRAELFSELGKLISSPETIILISPNHYSAGNGNIQVSDQEWRLGQGQISADKKVITYLTQKDLALNEPSSFTNEHGIYNILSDIHNNFPKAKLVPIIFENASEDQLTKLEKGLYSSCKNCLMIASVDFSHYQPALLAQLHDERSIRDLQTLDTQDVLKNAEVDSGPALALLTMWAKEHNTLHFNLKNHTNSGILTKNPDAESTTHVFGWYESGEIVTPEKSVSFTVGGDMMFARMIYHDFHDDFNNAFSQFGDRVFWGTDAAFANLEGAITNKPIVDNIQPDNVSFRFSPEIIKTLSFLHLNAVSQANNHSNNAGQEGVDTTRAVLASAKIQVFGGPTESDVSRVAYFKGEGMSLAVIGIEMTLGQDPKILVPIIKEIKKDPNARVMIMPHWGTEYLFKHTSTQSDAAHLWIDAGADIVIGSHPHVVEYAELYRGAPIFYSLGNFLFDQFALMTQKGLLISGKFTPDGLTLFGLPIQSFSNQPRLVTGKTKKTILDSLYVPFKKYITDTPAGEVVQLYK